MTKDPTQWRNQKKRLANLVQAIDKKTTTPKTHTYPKRSWLQSYLQTWTRGEIEEVLHR